MTRRAIQAEGGTAVLDRPEVDDGDTTEHDDWYVLKGEREWKQPCGRSGIYMAEGRCPHRILVWPSENDPTLVKAAKLLLKEDGEMGKVLGYEKSMGPCVSFYEAYPS
jgi:hypothetical protein